MFCTDPEGMFVWTDYACIHPVYVEVVVFSDLFTGDPFACMWVTSSNLKTITRKVRQMAKSFAEEVLRKKKARAESDYTVSDEKLVALAPNVHELMTRKLKDGKKALGVAALSVWSDDEGWHGKLTHRGVNVSWRALSDTFEGLLPALERAVSKEEASEVNGHAKTRSRPV